MVEHFLPPPYCSEKLVQKILWGFDSSLGFPNSYSEFDDIKLNEIDNYLSPVYEIRQKRLLDIRKFLTNSKIDKYNISSSGNFSDSKKI